MSDIEDMEMKLAENGYWDAVDWDPAAPFTVVPFCRSSIRVLEVLEHPVVPAGRVRQAIASLKQLRAGLITAPEVRVLDECLREVKRLLEEQ